MHKKGLFSDSYLYYKKSDIYEMFSNAEDKPSKIYKFFLPIIKDKIVLDLGCGNGKYLKLFSKEAKLLYGIDKSKLQIQRAQNKLRHDNNVNLIYGDANNIPLKNKSVDIVFSSWVLGTIEDERQRIHLINEAMRVLKENGLFYLVENDYGSEFENIRGRVDDPLQRTIKYNNWLKEKIGFKEIKKIKTYFEFESLEQCKTIIQSIWGKKAATKIINKFIKHNIVIFEFKLLQANVC